MSKLIQLFRRKENEIPVNGMVEKTAKNTSTITPAEALKKGLPLVQKVVHDEKYQFTVNNQIGIAIAFKAEYSTYTLIFRLKTAEDIMAIGENIAKYSNYQLLTTAEAKEKRAVTFRHFSSGEAFTIKNGWR